MTTTARTAYKETDERSSDRQAEGLILTNDDEAILIQTDDALVQLPLVLPQRPDLIRPQPVIGRRRKASMMIPLTCRLVPTKDCFGLVLVDPRPGRPTARKRHFSLSGHWSQAGWEAVQIKAPSSITA